MSSVVKSFCALGLSGWMKSAAAVGFTIAFYNTRDDIILIPTPLIGLGIAVLQIFLKSRIFTLGFYWILYTLLTYLLVSYHEFDVCVLESCTHSELTSQISIISTGVLWASLDITQKRSVITQVSKSGFFLGYKPDDSIQLRWV